MNDREYINAALEALHFSEPSDSWYPQNEKHINEEPYYKSLTDEEFLNWAQHELTGGYIYRVYETHTVDDIDLDQLQKGYPVSDILQKKIIPTELILDNKGWLKREEWRNSYGDLSSPHYKLQWHDLGWPAVIEYDTNMKHPGNIYKVQWWEDGKLLKEQKTEYFQSDKPQRPIRESWWFDDKYSYNGEFRRSLKYSHLYNLCEQLINLYETNHVLKGRVKVYGENGVEYINP